jgi:hypothetical protein
MIKINKYVAILMLSVMTAYSVPKELLHEFHHHTDTVDIRYKSDATREVGSKHIHCDVFDFNGPVLFYSFQDFNFSEDFIPHNYNPSFTEEYFYHSTFANFKRGPPSFLIG